jgi:hypothetical protein
MSQYRNNHYVPVWYQERFIPQESRERKFHYVDLRPETINLGAHRYSRNSNLRWGPKKCFCQKDLYTTQLGTSLSTEIERSFFGPLDDSARPALDYFTNFSHPAANGDLFHTFLLYLSIQKLRTPKGLRYLSSLARISNNNALLFALQRLQALFCAIWTESIWSIVDTNSSDIGLILSDHPVTVYNQGCFPASSWCRDGKDPHTWLSGTHTLFPLQPNKLLIMTNLSWVRHPYGNPVKKRPNPSPLRPAIFNFTSIQTGRSLSTQEVAQINYIIKQRAYRYIAAHEKDWLYPEKILGRQQWDSFGKNYLLMPDPRSVTFSSEILMGFNDGSSDAYDEYGRKPWDPSYLDESRKEKDWETFHAFQGEFARRFGPVRRGRAYEFGKQDQNEDDPDFHKYHLSLEQRNKKHRYDR